MKNNNRYRRTQYDNDRYTDRNRRYSDRYSDYNDDFNESNRYDNSRENDFNTPDHNYSQSGRNSYTDFNRSGYPYDDGRNSRNRQYGNNSGYDRPYNNVNDDYYTFNYQRRNYGPANYGTDWRNDNWNRGNENENYYGNMRDYNSQDRGWWDKTRDEVSSWFGDDDAKRRRRMDDIRDHRGKGPKNYQRSSERIKEDVNDKLGDHWMLDASNIEVEVTGSEVTLSGTVNSRDDKRRAEDIAEDVSGVTHVQNNLRVSNLDEDTADKTKPYSTRTRKNEIHHN